MEAIAILLKYGGVWVGGQVYETNLIEGILVSPNVSLNLLKIEIASQIGFDLTKKNMSLKYRVEGNNVPLQIHNDMGVKVYLSLLKSVDEFTRLPLCVDSVDYEVGSSHSVPKNAETTLLLVEPHETLEEPQNIISDPKHKIVEVNQTYKDKETVVSVMHGYALEHRFQFYTKRSEAKSYECICCADGCPWYFRASRVRETKLFKVRVFDNVHTCPLPERAFFQRQATTKLVAAVCLPQLKDHKRKYTPIDIRSDILNNMGVQISYNKAWRAKQLAIQHLLGGPSDGYKQLPVYMHVLGEAYPGSYLRYHKNDMDQFMYLFIALNVCIEGFQHCRLVVVVDGSHLSGPYMGTFVSACTLDGAGHILPLAYGVVDSENVASWSWFFTQFRAAFGVRRNMAIVSDRNDSIWKSVRTVYPDATHFACMWHIWKNVCGYYRRSQRTLSSLYYAMARAYRHDVFDQLMAEMEATDPRVTEYLADVGYDKWARVYAPVNRGRMMTSNIAECVNSCLVDARRLPLLEFLEKARELFARWNVVNGDKARYMSSSLLGDTFQDILRDNIALSTRLTAVKNSECTYTVDAEGIRYIVKLKQRTCTCNKFQYDGIPCEHAIAVLRAMNITDTMSYCSNYYKKETLEKIYKDPFAPISLKQEWAAPEAVASDVVLPPGYRRPPGRPKGGRVRSKGEKMKSSSNSCGKCGRVGHNRRTCKFFPKEG